MNIYGDYKICRTCGMKADVIERGRDYCAECWFNMHSDRTFESIDKEIQESENEKNKT
jgi:predicted amidophosphoribosyltransferase